jgi:hypothetical protein
VTFETVPTPPHAVLALAALRAPSRKWHQEAAPLHRKIAAFRTTSIGRITRKLPKKFLFSAMELTVVSCRAGKD